MLNSFLVKGERCSGTNYLEKLIEENLCIPLLDSPEWKHGYFSFSVTENFTKPEGINYLTIIIFRNVFDWLRSFYLSPHHLLGAKSGHWEDKPTFSEFIRREIKMIDSDNKERMMDKHPFYLENPKNILELRKWKIENWLSYKKVEKPVYYIKYEDLLKNPEKIINEINNKWFNVDFKFKNWNYYKKENTKYKPKEYFTISNYDLNYLNNSIDWCLEKQIGYE